MIGVVYYGLTYHKSLPTPLYLPSISAHAPHMGQYRQTLGKHASHQYRNPLPDVFNGAFRKWLRKRYLKCV
jgi:hypothetical protein